MTLKQRIIREIESLTPEDLLVVQNVVHALTRKAREKPTGRKDGYLRARKALAGCRGELSEEIINAREDRV